MISATTINRALVSTHSRLKAAGADIDFWLLPTPVSTHSRLKAAERLDDCINTIRIVSTHSRLKAAAFPFRLFLSGRLFQHTAA